jgi:hypothetical protein
MGLTRPRFSQFDTTISSISDPVTVLNKSSTLANVDVGFIMNRDGGALANTAIFWNESANTFALAFTTNSGEVPNANIAISTYANLRVSTLTATFVNTTGNIVSGGNVTAPYFFGNGSQLSGVITSVTKIINGTSDVTAYSGGNVAVTVGGTANTILFTNSITSTSNVTGALRVSGLGGIGVGGNLYVGQRVGFVWGANNVSSVYQVFNNSTNSLDTVFG